MKAVEREAPPCQGRDERGEPAMLQRGDVVRVATRNAGGYYVARVIGTQEAGLLLEPLSRDVVAYLGDARVAYGRALTAGNVTLLARGWEK